MIHSTVLMSAASDWLFPDIAWWLGSIGTLSKIHSGFHFFKCARSGKPKIRFFLNFGMDTYPTSINCNLFGLKLLLNSFELAILFTFPGELILAPCSSYYQEEMAMLKRFALMTCLVLLISSCEPANPTARPINNNSPTISPTLAVAQAGATSSPVALSTMTPIPTFTPPSGFSPHGSFLAFTDDPVQPAKITLFDPVQQSIFVISKPAGDMLQWGAGGLSPDGQYLAFYTGHLDSLTDLSALPTVPQQIVLNILRTLDGKIVFQKSLLNKDYPQNFLQAADGIIANPPADFGAQANSRNDLASSLLAAFTTFIYANSWSPDGNVLAFASGSDGTSSDVYTYNLNTGVLTRITDGPSEVYKIMWSPDGNWILNSGIYFVGEGLCGTWYLSAATGSGSSGFSIKGADANTLVRGCDFDEWVSDHQALVSEDANGRGTFNLEVMDIDQKSIDLIWPHNFHSFAFDPVAQQAYISTAGEQQQDGTYFQQGTYRVDLATRKTVSIGPDLLSLQYLGWGSGQIIAGIPGNIYDLCFLPSGSCSVLANFDPKQFSGLSVSSNRQNLALFSDNGLWHVFPDSASQTARRDYTGRVGAVIWSPDTDSNPANDWGLLETNSPVLPYYLYNTVTGLTNPLSDFTGSYFQGWYWRK
jgi:WD40-like Beta Propeller Repeat